MSASTRRAVGGYDWLNELDNIVGLGEKLVSELTEMSKTAPTVEVSRRHTQLIGYTSQLTITALKLKSYRTREKEES